MKLFFGAGKERPIYLATDIRDHLPEDKKYQYRDDFSMAETSKSWVSADGCLPREIATIVGTNELNSAHFEYPTRVWGNGMAMTDVMAFVPHGVVAVEAKVDEPLDDIVSVWINRNAIRNTNSPPHRKMVIERYAKAFGVETVSLMYIRYQLLQRTLCAALTARSQPASQAWMIVQSFLSSHGEGHRLNRADFDRYVALVGDAPTIIGVQVKLAWASARRAD